MPATAPPPYHVHNAWGALPVLLTATFVVTLDVFIVFVATPSIAAGLDASPDEIQWVVAAYILTFALGLISGGRLGDLVGRRRTFSLGLLVFGLSSALGGTAPDAAVLIVARTAQGAGAALMIPQVFSIIRVEFEPGERARALAVVGVVQGAAAVCGQLVGALLIELAPLGLGWRSVFLVNVPICAAGFVLSRALVPESRVDEASRLDSVGVGLAILAVGSLAIPLIEGRSAGWPVWVFACLAAAGPLALAFVAWERQVAVHGRSPLVALDIFELQPFRLGVLLSLLFYTSSPGVILILMVYMQDGLGFSPLAAGLTYTPAALGFSLAAIAVGRLGISRREHALLPGIFTTAAGVLGAATTVVLAGDPAPAALVPTFLLIGLGHGSVIPALNGTVLASTPREQAGLAAGILATAQQLGGALGIAVAATVFFSSLGSGTGAAPYGKALALSSACCLMMLGAAAMLGWRLFRTVDLPWGDE